MVRLKRPKTYHSSSNGGMQAVLSARGTHDEDKDALKISLRQKLRPAKARSHVCSLWPWLVGWASGPTFAGSASVCCVAPDQFIRRTRAIPPDAPFPRYRRDNSGQVRAQPQKNECRPSEWYFSPPRSCGQCGLAWRRLSSPRFIKPQGLLAAPQFELPFLLNLLRIAVP